MYQQKRVCPPNYLLENSHNKDKKRKRPSNKAVHLSLFPRSLKAEIFFFLPEPGSSILHCTRIISCPASIHTGKITKNELRFSNLFVRQEFNFRAYFFFKNHKIQKNHFRFTPAYRGTPLSWWQGPPLFSFGLLSTMEITFWDRNKISCPVNLRGVGNDFSITFLCF